MSAAELEGGSVVDPSTVDEASTWLATGGADKSRNVVVQLRERFGLSPKGACDAIRESLLKRGAR